MKKLERMKLRFKKILSVFLITSVLVISTPLPVFAQGAGDPCDTPNNNPEECIYYNNRKAHPNIDISSTSSNLFLSSMLYPVTLATGYSLGQLHACISDFVSRFGLGGFSPECQGLGDPSRYTRTSGTLMGVTTLTNEAAFKTPAPVSLAYYINYTAQRIPLLKNTAFAQDKTLYKNQPLLDHILKVWVVTRNLAYGALAVAMLVIGIMIMTRKELSPRVNVTVQNALPRVVLALILITFSYPIGALAASLTGPLNVVPGAIFNDLNASLGWVGLVSDVVVILMLIGITIATGGVAAFVFIGFGIIWLILWFIIAIKGLIITLKIIISIVSAPLTFAFGAIPGNEALTVNWFKLLAVRVVSIPAMYFGLHFAFFIMRSAWSSFFNINLSWDIGYILSQLGTATFVAFSAPLLGLWILIESTKIPGRLEEAFLEPKKPTRRK